MRRSGKKVDLILCSDLHLSHQIPSARSSEPDWYEAMARPLRQVARLAEEHEAPVVIAGDLTHRWYEPPELINFAIRELSRWSTVYAVPGNHDLPYHSYAERRRSAFWTLVESGVVKPLEPGEPVEEGLVRLYGFPYGYKLTPPDKTSSLLLHVAVVHSFVWIDGHAHVMAPEEAKLKRFKKALRGYDVAAFGDNHIGFTAKSGRCRVINCGCLIRRRADEAHLTPSVGLLHPDGTLTCHPLDCTEDRIEEAQTKSTEGVDAGALVAEVLGLREGPVDFSAALRRAVDADDVTKGVRRVVLAALDKRR